MKLSKKDLKNLYHMDKELDDIDRRIFELNEKIYSSSNIVSDTVKDYSYDAKGRVIAISGYDKKRFGKKMETLTTRLNRRKEAYLTQRDFVERCIDDIGDVEIRRIIGLRYIDRLSWENVAAGMGPYASADAVRLKLERYLEN